MKIFVIGTGSWATALANVLADNQHEVLLYGRNSDVISEINTNHTNQKYFKDTPIHPGLKATDSLSALNDYDILLFAVTSSSCCPLMEKISTILNHPVIVVNAAKGFHPETYRRLSEEMIDRIQPDYLLGYYALIGPSHAEEVIERQLTTINIVGENKAYAEMLQKLFSNSYFRVYRNDDLIGCEYAAGLKNIIAIASGILYGIGLGDNAKASLMTRGLAEMTRFGLAKGGKLESFIGLCGMGDLIVTCTSVHSRNWQAGYMIGQHDDSGYFWQHNTNTVEGVNACRIIHEVAKKENIPMPITDEVYNVLFQKKKPSTAMKDLMSRTLKEETY